MRSQLSSAPSRESQISGLCNGLGPGISCDLFPCAGVVRLIGIHQPCGIDMGVALGRGE
jgi:hypothetical protein